MKKFAVLSLVVFFVFLAAAIAIMTIPSKKDKPPKAPSIKPQPVSSNKLKIGEVTISYKYLHKAPSDHVDVTFIFATSKPVKSTLSYSIGLSGNFKKETKKNMNFGREHYIILHEVEPATNFNYQISVRTADGKTAITEKRGFLTPPHQEENPEASNLFSPLLRFIKSIFDQ